MKNCYIIFHRKDWDGHFAGAILKKWFVAIGKSPIMVPFDYGDDLSVIERIPDGSRVSMTDISLPKSDMWKLAERTHLTYIDHHQTQIEEFGLRRGGEPSIIFTDDIAFDYYVNANKSATELCWELYGEDLGIAQYGAMSLVGIYDTFRVESPQWEEALAFQYGLRSFPMSIEQACAVLDSNAVFEHILEKGETLLDYVRQQDMIKFKSGTTYTVPLGMQRFFPDARGIHVVNAVGINTEMIQLKHDIVLFMYAINDGVLEISLRARGGKNDVGTFAKSMGGGGHMEAAGLKLKRPYIEPSDFKIEISGYGPKKGFIHLAFLNKIEY
jgi:oligoribonuclease NrnB/cAMP/cGMP phosphodiesterase (DHH superfamily)